MNILKIVNLTKSFSRYGKKHYPIKDLNFIMNEGDFSVIMGRSGTGKTTLLNMIALFLQPDFGSIIYNDLELTNFTDDESSSYRNQEIGFLTQNPTTIPSLNVCENILLPYCLNDKQFEINQWLDELLTAFGIIHLKNEWVKNLSGGEKKRVCIARALINKPKLLILDEPTSDLDETTADNLRDTLLDLNQKGLSILVVTHDIAFKQYGVIYKIINGKINKEKN